VQFIENSAYSGGAIYAQEGSTVIFLRKVKLLFDGNVATSSGGVIFADMNSLVAGILDIDFFEFKNSSVRDVGGAIYVDNHSMTIFSEIDIFRATYNSASSGGFVYVTSNSKSIFDANDKLILAYNTAANAGGAIYVADRSTVVFSNIRFMEVLNNKSINGDGIFYAENKSEIIFERVYNILAQSNEAVNGGFVSLSNGSGKYSSSFQVIENTATGGTGGGFSIINSYAEFNTDSAIADSEFRKNVAISSGGAIYMQDSNLIIKALAYNTEFKDNREFAGSYQETDNDINMIRSQATFISAKDKIIKIESGIKTDGTSKLSKEGYGDLEIGGLVIVKGHLDVWDGYVSMNTQGGSAEYPNIDTVYVDRFGTFRTKTDKETYIVDVRKLDLFGTLGLGVDTDRGIVKNDLMRFEELNIDGGQLEINWEVFEPINADEIVLIEAGQINGVFSNYPHNGEQFISGQGTPFKSIYTLYYDYNYESSGIDRIVMSINRRYDYEGITGLTPNQKEAAKQVDKMDKNGIMDSLFRPLTEEVLKEYRAGDEKYNNTKTILTQLSGSFLADAISISAQNNSERLYSKLIYQEGRPNEESGILQLIWMQGEMGGGQYKAENDEYIEETRHSNVGVMAGFPLWRGKSDIGVYGGYSSKEIKQAENKGNIDDIEGGLYLSHYGEKVSLKGNIGISQARYITNRKVEFLGYKETATADFDIMNIRFGLEIEYEKQLDKETKAKPFIGISGGVSVNKDIEEQYGNAINLKLKADKYSRVDLTGGLKIEDAYGLFNWNIRGYGGYVLEGDRINYEMSWQNMINSNMNIEGSQISRLYGGISGWIEYELGKNLSVFVNADFRYGKDNINYYGNSGIKYHIVGKRRDIREVKQANELRNRGEIELKESDIEIIGCEFGLGEYKVNEQGAERIRQIAQEIKKLKWTRVTAKIVVDTNDYTLDEDRIVLANERAKAVYEELYKNGIDIDGLEYKVEGSENVENIDGINSEYDLGSESIDSETNKISTPANKFQENQVIIKIKYLRY
jgi:predicted outer membrane repeat protein